MSDRKITCEDVRRYYLREDFLRYLLRVLPRRTVVLCTASEPMGRYQQCRPRLFAESLEELRHQITFWLDSAFDGLGPDDVPPVYPSLHYAVCRHWPGGRDWVIEADADEWQQTWEAIEPVVGLIEALEVPYTLRYSGHCSPHLCVAEEDFLEPSTLAEAVRLSKELETAVQRRLATNYVLLTEPISRLPYSFNEETGLICIEVPPQLYGAFEPSYAHLERVIISPMWPPEQGSEQARCLIEWARGQRDVHAAPIHLFSRPPVTPTPPAVQAQLDTEAEFKRLRGSLLPKVEAAPHAPADSLRPPEGMTYIPAGAFISGSPWPVVHDLAAPMMAIAETQAFFIDICPVTNAQYTEFIRDGGYERKELWSAEGWEFVQACGWRGPSEPCEELPPNAPVCGVSYFEAEAYTRWCGKRLPTLQEWEKACRGTDGRRWPWGDEFDVTRCNTADRSDSDEDWEPTPVGMFPTGMSPYGCLDMVGNVWEWIQDVMVIGGSFVSHMHESNGCEYHGQEPHYRPHKVGFRCVKDVNA